MKKFLSIAISIMFLCPCFTASANTVSVNTEANQYQASSLDNFPGGDRKAKKHRQATYGKKKGSKGTSCKKKNRIMSKRHGKGYGKRSYR